jgi:hypothetical protein
VDEKAGAGLGARLLALGGLELGDFDAVPAAPDTDHVEAERSSRTPRRTLIVSAVFSVILLGCLGTAVFLFVRINKPSAQRPPPPRPALSATGPAAAGPHAINHEVRAENDLDRVCANWFYPSAPQHRGDAPHPVFISEGEAAAPESRTTRTLNRAAFAGSAVQRRTWAPDPERVQLVACLDLTGPGKKIRDCASGGEKLPLVEGRYRLTVYEVATHSKVVEKALTGADRACPFVVLQSGGDTLHSAVLDRQLYDLLRKRVEG